MVLDKESYGLIIGQDQSLYINLIFLWRDELKVCNIGTVENSIWIKRKEAILSETGCIV